MGWPWPLDYGLDSVWSWPWSVGLECSGLVTIIGNKQQIKLTIYLHCQYDCAAL